MRWLKYSPINTPKTTIDNTVDNNSIAICFRWKYSTVLRFNILVSNHSKVSLIADNAILPQWMYVMVFKMIAGKMKMMVVILPVVDRVTTFPNPIIVESVYKKSLLSILTTVTL